MLKQPNYTRYADGRRDSHQMQRARSISTFRRYHQRGATNLEIIKNAGLGIGGVVVIAKATSAYNIIPAVEEKTVQKKGKVKKEIQVGTGQNGEKLMDTVEKDGVQEITVQIHHSPFERGDYAVGQAGSALLGIGLLLWFGSNFVGRIIGYVGEIRSGQSQLDPGRIGLDAVKYLMGGIIVKNVMSSMNTFPSEREKLSSGSFTVDLIGNSLGAVVNSVGGLWNFVANFSWLVGIGIVGLAAIGIIRNINQQTNQNPGARQRAQDPDGPDF
ncbi:hypothetical protein HY570_01760 [Candidatus Micrarchaeota archaeon]|nr:hypothetical protein [Candidatus Micrarchaeota archaeon]